ncbi:MAG: hypothetical protein ACK5JF_12485 [Oscillospiraceae bacterium]
MDPRENSFTYTYSAAQQAEIKKIRQKYMPPEENKLEQLRRLDKSAQNRGTAVAIAVGVVGTLLLGIGMCCTMVWTGLFIPGVIIGVLGIGVLSVAYPLYNTLVKKQRQKLAPQILKISDELMQPTQV